MASDKFVVSKALARESVVEGRYEVDMVTAETTEILQNNNPVSLI